jgi:hypothetical protein
MDKYILHLEEQNQELQQRLANAEKELFYHSALKPHWKVPHVITRPLMNGTITKICHPYGTAFYEIGHIEHDELSDAKCTCDFYEPVRGHIPTYMPSSYNTLEHAKHAFENMFWNYVYADLIEDSFGHFVPIFNIDSTIKAV